MGFGRLAFSRRICAFAAAGLGLALGACGSSDDGGDSRDSEVAVKADDTVTIRGPAGTAVIHGGDDVKVTLPAGFTIPEKTRVVTTTQFENGGVPTILAVFESELGPEEIIAHFRKQAEAAGFKIDVESKTETGMNIVSIADKNGRRFMAGAERRDGKTNGQVTISQ